MALRIILPIEMRNNMLNINQMLEVYFIAGTQDCENKDLLTALERALKAGITCFQLREKGTESLAADKEQLKELAWECQKLCEEYQVPFIINDYVHLAVEVSADGIHVGQEDLEIEKTIQLFGKDKIIGLSTNTKSEFHKAQKKEHVDYLGLGPVFPTGSKKDYKQPLGVEGLNDILQQSAKTPVVAIGGIKEDNAKDVLHTNVDGIAVISAIIRSDDIYKTVKNLKGV